MYSSDLSLLYIIALQPPAFYLLMISQSSQNPDITLAINIIYLPTLVFSEDIPTNTSRTPRKAREKSVCSWDLQLSNTSAINSAQPAT
jgi:hypothetical protein